MRHVRFPGLRRPEPEWLEGAIVDGYVRPVSRAGVVLVNLPPVKAIDAPVEYLFYNPGDPRGRAYRVTVPERERRKLRVPAWDVRAA